MKKRNGVYALGVILFLIVSCHRTRPVYVSVIPTKEGVEMNYVGYVTDSKFELVSQLHSFSRVFAGKGEVDGHEVYFFESNDEKTPFYIDPDGSVWQKNKEDLSLRVSPYGYKTPEKLVIYYWQPLLKMNAGEKTRWEFSVDTTFLAVNPEGKLQKIHYHSAGKARYGGWSTLTVPERRDKPYQVISADWYEVKTSIVNMTTGDTLFATTGTARQYFEPILGSIRYMTDFTLSELGKQPVFRRGTWDLVKKRIPK